VTERHPDLSPEDHERVARLAARVRAPLADGPTALAAVTHKSWVNEHRGEKGEDNERLEFLGDAVIDLLVSDYLMARFPGAREGELSKLRAAVVDEPGLAAMARALELGELLRLGRGEEITGGRAKASLLADAMEAVVAAVFLEGGLLAAHRLVDPFLEEAYARAESGTLDRDFKTQLQEIGQSRFRASPRYRVVAEVGPDHAKTFEIEVELAGEVRGRGAGRSKKDAEQAAARVALDAIASLPAPTDATPAREGPIESPPTPAPAGASPAGSEPVPAPEPAPPDDAAGQTGRKVPARRASRARRKPAAAARKPARKKPPPKGRTTRRTRKIAVPRGRD
jgi:ribonuclease III